MKKNVVIINDQLGTMALGFSKAGYDIKAIYIDMSEINNSRVCRENWGDIVRELNSEKFFHQDMSSFWDIECIAGRVIFNSFSVIGNSPNYVDKKNSISQIQYMIKETRPKCFLLQCNRINKMDPLYFQFCESVAGIGYDIRIEIIDTRYITGFPVNEKLYFIIGALNSNDIKLEFIKSIDTPEHPIEKFFEKEKISEEWYYKVNPHYLTHIERENDNCILCWHNNHYREEDTIKWNSRMTPLIVQRDIIRKITHREIARMKGIPDEYMLFINNKSVLYTKLMYCPNVQLIQQLASTICFEDGEKPYQNREFLKAFQFEKVILSYFEQKGIHNILDTKNINSYIDFQCKTGSEVYSFDFKIYRNNVGIRNKVIAASKKLSENKALDGTNRILVVGNIVENETKKYIAEKDDIFIWDIANLLWIFSEFPQQKSDFVSLLSFDVSDVVPQKPEPGDFDLNTDNSAKVDLQEQLRRIQPGLDDANKYESLCTDIMKYLFSESIEFNEPQKKSNSGLYRFDYCGKIKHGNKSEFFETVQRFFKTKYIIFEFKNYAGEITQNEITTTEKYLYEKALRKVVIIVSRKGTDENARKASRGSLREMGKLIICLSDEDVNKLIDMKNNKEDPADYLETLLDDMLMDLEK